MNVTASPESHSTLSPEVNGSIPDTLHPLTADEVRIKSLYHHALEQITFKSPTDVWYQMLKKQLAGECLVKECSARTEYYRKSLSFLLEGHPPSLIQCESVDHFPLPLSRSITTKIPFSISCKNMIIQLLVKGRLKNESSSISYLTWYVSRCFSKQVSPEDLLRPFQIQFKQQNCQYELALTHLLFIKIFFPNVLADIVYETNPNELYSSFQDLFNPYSFFVSDRRFNERLLGSTFVFESMLATDSLDLILDPLAKSKELCSSMMRYVAFLLYHGISTSAHQLSPSLIMTLFKVSLKLLEQTDHPLRPRFYEYVWEAFKAVEKHDPNLAHALRPLPEVQAPKRQNEPFFSYRPEDSFLLRDLESGLQNPKVAQTLHQPANAQKQQHIHHVCSYQQVGDLLLEQLITKPKGLHFVFVTNGTADFMQECLLGYFKQKVFNAWSRYVQTVPAEKAIEQFVKLWNLSQKKNTPLLLQVIALLDPTKFFQTYKDANFIRDTGYRPGDVAIEHIQKLCQQVITPEQNAHVMQKIQMAAESARTWLRATGKTDLDRGNAMYACFAVALEQLASACEKNIPLAKIIPILRNCFNISGQHRGHTNQLEAFFTQLLLSSHILTITLDTSTSPQVSDNELRLVNFVSSQLFASTHEMQLQGDLQQAGYLHLLNHLIFITGCHEFRDLDATIRLNRPILSYIVFDQSAKDLRDIDTFIQNRLQTL